MRALLLAGLAAVLPLQAQPGVQQFTLPNGLRILHLEDHEHPLVRARLHFAIRTEDTPQGRQGLPLLLLRMFNHSETADLKAEDLDRILEESGIQLRPTLEPGGLVWNLVARSRDQDRALGLLADRLLRTVFSSRVLEVQRLATWQEVEREDLLPPERLQRALLGDPATRPTALSLGIISLEDLLAYHARVLRPDRAVLVLHGDLGLEQAKRLVLLSLGTWTTQVPAAGAGQPTQSAQPPSAPSPAAQLRIPAPDRSLRIQAVAPLPAELSPEVAALLRLLVPGDPDLRPLCLSLQEGQLLVTLAQERATGAGAWALVHERLESFRRRGFHQADLDRARRAWRLRCSLDSLHPEAQMDAALAGVLGRGATEERMLALTLDTLNAGLKAWLDPARIRLGALGDPELLKALPKP